MRTSTAPLPPVRSVKVLDQLRERTRYLHCSLRTEQAYVHWVRTFIRLKGVGYPAFMGRSSVALPDALEGIPFHTTPLTCFPGRCEAGNNPSL